eukprot:g37936.t1
MQLRGYYGWTVGRVEQIVMEAKDGQVIRGVGAGVKVNGNQKVGFVGGCRAQVLRELVPESVFVLPDIEETTSGGTDTVDEIRFGRIVWGPGRGKKG